MFKFRGQFVRHSVLISIYWVGQKGRSGFSTTSLQKNQNERFGQSNISRTIAEISGLN